VAEPEQLIDVPEEMYAELQAIADNIGQKVDNIGWVWRTLEAEAACLRDEEKRLADKRRAREAGVARLKKLVLWSMASLGEKKLSGNVFSVTRQANPPSCGEVDEDKALVAGLAEEVTTIKVNRKGIIDAWKANPDSVAGFAQVVTSEGVSLR
jgi:hypothetical protein